MRRFIYVPAVDRHEVNSNVSQDFDEVEGQQTPPAPQPAPQPASQLPRTELDSDEDLNDHEVAIQRAMAEAQDQAGDLNYTTSITSESDLINYSDDES
jgi:hypothetical protein